MSTVQPGTPDWYTPQIPQAAPLVKQAGHATGGNVSFGPFFVASYESVYLYCDVPGGSDYCDLNAYWYADPGSTVLIGQQVWNVFPGHTVYDTTPNIGAWLTVSVAADPPVAGHTFSLTVVPLLVTPNKRDLLGSIYFSHFENVAVAAGAQEIWPITRVAFGRYSISTISTSKNWHTEVWGVLFPGPPSKFLGAFSSGGTERARTVEIVNPGMSMQMMITNDDAAAQTFSGSALLLG